jgi:hypothetical protein
MSDLQPVINQVHYPGVGDVDDCAVIATFWTARAGGYVAPLPTVAAFREAAGRPDQPGPTGLNNDQVWAGVTGTALRTLRGAKYAGPWGPLSGTIRGGAPASLAVLSSVLPAKYRFGFLGAHRIGVQYHAGRFYLANPLAPEGSTPLPIAESYLAAAALAVGVGRAYAVTFPPTPVLHHVLISAHAPVRIATLSAQGCVASWSTHRWGPRPSSARCSARFTLPACSNPSRRSTVVKVASGAFKGKIVHIGTGVTSR